VFLTHPLSATLLGIATLIVLLSTFRSRRNAKLGGAT